MSKQSKQSKKKGKKFNTFFDIINVLNDNKYFAGIIMLTMNIGTKYVMIDLSKTQENYVKYSLGRQLVIFSILWIGTRDIFISLILTAIFILLVDYIFNENSKYCIIPDKYKQIQDIAGGEVVTQKQVNDAINVLKQARKTKNDKENNDNINEVLYKENFI
jgi:hypothetical protein